MKRVLRWVLTSLGVLIALVLVAAGVLYAVGGRKLAAKQVVATEQPLVIPTDSASVARGAYLVGSRPCGACHGDDLGGRIFADAAPFALLVGPNLTRGLGGRTPPLTDAEWERAIRHGVRRDSTGLIIMPSEEFHAIADTEMAAMIAYLKQMPPVDREVPPTTLRFVGRLVLGIGQVKTAAALTPTTAHAASVDTTTGAEYGSYLIGINGCRGCHGQNLSGGPALDPGGKPASNLTPTGIGHYTDEDFKRTMRTGQRPGNGGVLTEDMPWKFFGKMSDGDLQAISTYLKTLPAKQFAEK